MMRAVMMRASVGKRITCETRVREREITARHSNSSLRALLSYKLKQRENVELKKNTGRNFKAGFISRVASSAHQYSSHEANVHPVAFIKQKVRSGRQQLFRSPSQLVFYEREKREEL
jgi:hypothetical protein